MNLGSVTPSIPRERAAGVPALPDCWGSPVCMLTPFNAGRPNWPGNTYREGRVLGQPRHCICTNASRGLSAIAEFLVGDFAEGFPWNFTTALGHTKN